VDVAVPSLHDVEALLSARFGKPVRVEALEHLAPWAVQRCTLAGAPSPLIVKWVRDDPNGFRTDPRQLATEYTALEFLNAIGFRQVPRPVAADFEAGLVAMEDLAPRLPLDGLIRRDGYAPWIGALHDFARVTGELAAATAGREARYDAIRAQSGPADPQAGRARGLGPLWKTTQPALEALGLVMGDAAVRDLARVVDALLNPDAFLAFTSGDPQANNFLVGDGGGRLIDFEAAAYRHAMTAAFWIHVPGTASITAADPIASDLEDTYRHALATRIAEAGDDRLFGFGMAAACLAEACDRFGRFPMLDKRKPGDEGRVQMVSTLEAAARAARRHCALPDLAGWAEDAAQWLRRRWPDADVDLSRLAPFTPRGRAP
jgi:hypothetical protein